MAKAEDHYTRVAEKLIERLKEGRAPWQNIREVGSYGARPMNPTTGKHYRGGNMLQLMLQECGDPRWLTYGQAQSIGAQVKKGEKGTPIIYWIFQEEHSVGEENGKLLKETVALERPRSFITYLFNAEQIEGLPPPVPDKPCEWADVERAKQIIADSGATIHSSQSSAYYRWDRDTIYLPEKEAFSSESTYYSTILHELSHWTSPRLNREVGPFGSMIHAKEELRAQISSVMFSAELGLGESVDGHRAYVQSWIKALKDDPRELFRAAADAEKIFAYVMGISG